MPRRVLIVDDHAGFRAVASELLESEGVAVIGAVSDGDEAVAATNALRPDVALVDVCLHEADGFAVADRLAALTHRPRVVLVSSWPVETFTERLEGATHIAGFLAKHELSARALHDLLDDGDQP